MDTERRRMVVFGGEGPYYGLDRNDAWSLSFGSAPVAVPVEVVATFPISAPMPNPFSSTTRVRFHLADPSDVEAGVFDVSGRKIRGLVNEVMAAGPQELGWDGADDHGVRQPAGLYFIRVTTKHGSATKRVVLLP